MTITINTYSTPLKENFMTISSHTLDPHSNKPLDQLIKSTFDKEIPFILALRVFKNDKHDIAEGRKTYTWSKMSNDFGNIQNIYYYLLKTDSALDCNEFELLGDHIAFKRRAHRTQLFLTANFKDVHHQYEIAKIYQEIFHDPKNTFEWLVKSASNGNPVACHEVADFYLRGEVTAKNEKLAYCWQQLSAKTEYVPAILALADYYYVGIGTRKSGKKAIDLVEKAADLGDPLALCALGLAYYSGYLKERNFSLATAFFKKAALHENAIAIYFLGKISEQKGSIQSIMYYQKSAELGLVEGQLKMAECYIIGDKLKKNLTLALEWFKRSLEVSTEDAIQTFFHWYSYIYDNEMFEESQEELMHSYEWHEEACYLKYPNAMEIFFDCYNKIKFDDPLSEHALKWHEMAASMGDHPFANYFWGMNLEKEGEFEEAKFFLEKAATQNYAPAKQRLQELYK